MKSKVYISVVALCFVTVQLFGIPVDTLRHYNPSAGTTTYTGYVLQVAYFVPQAPCSLKSVIIGLGGATGTATVHIYGHEGGNTVPQLEKDLVTPIVVNKTTTGDQKVQVTLPTGIYLANNHFFVGVSGLTAGVTLLADSEAKASECVSTTGGTYHYIYLKNSSNVWYYGNNAFVVDALVEYPLTSSPDWFKDVTLTAGIDTGLSGRSIAWGDFNNDGYLDLSVYYKLYKNNGNGTFTYMNAVAGIDTVKGVQGSLFADMDNDGFLDIIHIMTKDSLKIFRNNGNETFTRYTIPYLSGYLGWQGTSSFSVADVNLDKYPDLFIGRLWTSYPANGVPDTPPNQFFLNDQDYDLIDSTIMIYPAGYGGHRSRGSEWTDFDNDGDLDLYVANYYLERDELWQNNGDGTFTNIIAAKALDINSQGGSGHGTGVDWCDYDNDGDMDLLLSQLAHPNFVVAYDHRGTTIYRNEGGAGFTFTDLNATDGIDYEETHSGGSWGDVNNDGLPDIFITAYYGCRYVDFYLQKPDHTFEMKTYEYGFQNTCTNKDAAFVDFDNDGRLDLSSTDREDGVFRLYRNEAPQGGNYLELDLESTSGNHFAVGARAITYAGGKQYMQEVSAGRGQMMQKPSRLHFGLAGASVIDSVTVRWPNGTTHTEKFTGLAVNRRYTLKEGGEVIGGIKEIGSSALYIYPNPVENLLTISGLVSSNEMSVTIYNVLGEKVYSRAEAFGKNNDSQITIDVSDLKAGVYFVQVGPAKSGEKYWKGQFCKAVQSK